MLFSYFLLHERFSYGRQVSMIMVVIGVMIACKGDIEFTLFGFWITAFAVFTASAKAVVSSLVLTGENKLHPIDLIHRMSFLSTYQSLIWAFLNGEISDMRLAWNNITNSAWILVFFTGFIAFFFKYCIVLCE